MKLTSDAQAAGYITGREHRPCSKRTIRRYRSEEDPPLPATWSGRTWIYSTDEIDAWLDGRRARRHAA